MVGVDACRKVVERGLNRSLSTSNQLPGTASGTARAGDADAGGSLRSMLHPRRLRLLPQLIHLLVMPQTRRSACCEYSNLGLTYDACRFKSLHLHRVIKALEREENPLKPSSRMLG